MICRLPVALAGSVGMLPCRMWSQRGPQDLVNHLQHTVHRLYQVGFPNRSLIYRYKWEIKLNKIRHFYLELLVFNTVGGFRCILMSINLWLFGSFIHLAMDLALYKQNMLCLNETQDCPYLCPWVLLHLVCDIYFLTDWGEHSIRKGVLFLSGRYRGADKSLAPPTSRCILFDGENISFDASLVM